MARSQVVTPTKAARPRIDADLTARIDTLRGDVPFEKYVRNALREIVGGVMVEADPDAKLTDSVGRRVKGFRIVGADGSVLEAGLLEHEAIRRSYNIAVAARAYNVAHEMVSVMNDSASEEELGEMIELAERLYVMGNVLAGEPPAGPIDEDDDRDPGISPVTEEPWRIDPNKLGRPGLTMGKPDGDLSAVSERKAPPRKRRAPKETNA